MLFMMLFLLMSNQVSAMEENILQQTTVQGNIPLIPPKEVINTVSKLLNYSTPDAPVELWNNTFNLTRLTPEISISDLSQWVFALSFLIWDNRGVVISVTGYRHNLKLPVPLFKLTDTRLSESDVQKISSWLRTQVSLDPTHGELDKTNSFP